MADAESGARGPISRNRRSCKLGIRGTRNGFGGGFCSELDKLAVYELAQFNLVSIV